MIAAALRAKCWVGMWCLVAVLALAPLAAGAPGEEGKQGGAEVERAEMPPRPLDSAAAAERLEALEKENLVLREDLGKARLDMRVESERSAQRLSDAAAKFQRKVDELQEDLAAERAARERKERNLWLAVGVLAVALIASN